MTYHGEATVLAVDATQGGAVKATVRALSGGFGTMQLVVPASLGARPGDVRRLTIAAELGDLVTRDERANLECT